MDKLDCLACRRSYPHDPFSPFCPACGEPLFLSPRGGEKTIRTAKALALERFADFLALEDIRPDLSLGEGGTPLVPLNRLGAGLGLAGLLAKNEAQNPTGSFKDRGTAVAVQKAVSLGFTKFGTVSTGNMAASTAAYGARAGLETYVLLKEGTPAASLRAAGIFCPRLVSVRGDYGRLFHDSLVIGRNLGIYFANSIDPFRMEGYKITGFEMFLQLGRRIPRFIFVPLSSGGHLLGLMRAFEDLQREGLAPAFPTFVGVQAEGCAPIVRAFEAGREKYERLESSDTIAHAISNPAPPAGNAVLRMIREHSGILVSVSDAEMLLAQETLAAAEGLFCQPESAATLAALDKLAKSDVLGRDDVAVLVLTGSGLKTLRDLDSLPLDVLEIPLGELEAGLRTSGRT